MMQEEKVRDIKVNGQIISYYDSGSSKKVILLIHGFSFKVGFLRLIKYLSKDFRVIAPDLPGFGLSKVGEFNPTLSNYVDLLHDFLKAIGVKEATLFGNSMGGTLAILFAHKYPESADRLIVRSPLFFNQQLPLFLRHKQLLNIYEKLSGNNYLLKLFKNAFFAVYVKLSSQKDCNSDLLKEIRYQQENSLSVETGRKVVFQLGRIDLREIAKEINRPTLIIWGKDDNLLKCSGAKDLNKLIKGSELIIEETSVHNIITEEGTKLGKTICEWCK